MIGCSTSVINRRAIPTFFIVAEVLAVAGLGVTVDDQVVLNRTYCVQECEVIVPKAFRV